MNQEFQSGPPADDAGAGFQQFDADAVCEQCGSVNEEGTLLCKVCGQNLRDQRARRLSSAQGPEAFESKVSRVRLLTGLLVVLGLLSVVVVVSNIANIEASLVRSLSSDTSGDFESMWSGSDAGIYDQLQSELDEYPTSRARMEDSLENTVNDRSYNGRYILVRPGRLEVGRVIGEANLMRRGSRAYFVVKLRGETIGIRGYAELEPVGEEGELRPVAQDTASVLIDGEEYGGFGFAAKMADGGHRIVAASDYDGSGTNHELLAYRVR